MTVLNAPAAEPQRATPQARTALWASLVGTTIEWYDFFIFGTASALVFGRLFFPTFSELAGMLAAFASFAVGFVARPVGGLVFGHIGDRVGRKTTLVVTLTMMGVATFLMGVMPTYAAIGVWAPSEIAGSAAQLAVNLSGMVLAGMAVLLLQRLLWVRTLRAADRLFARGGRRPVQEPAGPTPGSPGSS